MIIPIREANRTIGHHETFPLAALLSLQSHALTFVFESDEKTMPPSFNNSRRSTFKLYHPILTQTPCHDGRVFVLVKFDRCHFEYKLEIAPLSSFLPSFLSSFLRRHGMESLCLLGTHRHPAGARGFCARLRELALLPRECRNLPLIVIGIQQRTSGYFGVRSTPAFCF